MKQWKRIFAIVLVFLLVLPMNVSAQDDLSPDAWDELLTFTEEELFSDPEGIDQGENVEQGEGVIPIEEDIEPYEPELPEEPVAEPEIRLEADRKSVDFGTIAEGSDPVPQYLTIYNRGNTGVTIRWDVVSAYDAFDIRLLSSPELSVDGSVEFSISLQPGLAADNYATNLTIMDSDGYCPVTIPLNARVEKQEDPAKVTKVDIYPAEADLSQGSSFFFTALLSGTGEYDQSVTWSLRGNTSSGTAINDNGDLTVDPGENSDMLVVTAQSAQSPEISDEAVVRVIKEKVAINTWANPEQGGYVTGGGSYDKNTVVELTASPEKGYRFKAWESAYGSRISTKRKMSVIAEEDTYYIATFEREGYSVTVRPSNEAYGETTGGGKDIASGDSVTIEAKPKDGYTFSGWYEDGYKVSDDRKFKVRDIDRNHEFVAEFRATDHYVNITASPQEGGTVTGGGRYKDNDRVRLVATTNPGYIYKGLSINGTIVTQGQEYSIEHIDRDLSVTAYFEKENTPRYKITSGVANAGGIITPSGTIEYAAGTQMTYTFAPMNGYAVLAVAVDGIQVGPVNSYTFQDIRADHMIAVAFAPVVNPVNQVTMDPIISTEEAAKIASAKLGTDDDGDARSSGIITPETYAAVKAYIDNSSELSVNNTKQNLIGMDDTEDLGNEVELSEAEKAGGLYQLLGITPAEADKMIDAGEDQILLQSAYNAGYLDILVNNDFIAPENATDLNDGVLDDIRLLQNLQSIVATVFTKAEKLQIFGGEKAALSFSATTAEPLDDMEKLAFADIEQAVIDGYFYMDLVKTVGYVSTPVTKLQSEITITLAIPKEYQAENVVYEIIRDHDGEISILQDIGSDPETITIKTDRFSTYAFAHTKAGAAAEKIPAGTGQNQKSIDSVNMIIIAGLIILAALIIVIVVLKKRRDMI